jgi:hypothetical protein
MGRIQPDRDQQRPHLALEEARHPGLLGRRALGVVDDLDAVAAQGRHHLGVEDAVLLVGQGMARAAVADTSRQAASLPAARAASSTSAKRTSKNSSRLDETMVM